MPSPPECSADDDAASADAIVLVDHGSRREEANSVVIETAARLARLLPDKRIEPAHCELATPSLEDAVGRCIAEGARRIVVQPFYLVPGRHSREDIPRIVDALARRYPEIRFWIGDPLGVHDALVAMLADRIRDADRRAPDDA